MLVLSRRPGQAIAIGDGVWVRVLEVRGSGEQAVVRLGIQAPANLPVLRDELYQSVASENEAAARLPAQLSDLAQALKRPPGA